MARQSQVLSQRWTLDKSTLMRNCRPVFQLTGVHSGEATVQERKQLREFIVWLLNTAEMGLGRTALICDFDDVLPYQ